MVKFLQKYISNVFISIVQHDNEWIIYSKILKNGKLKDKDTKNFEIKDHKHLPKKMEEYLNTIQAKHNFTYISLFLDSMGQGAISGTTAKDFEKNIIEVKSITHFPIKKKWSVYASFIDLNSIKKLFLKVGLDFIYSPFMVQYHLISKEKIKNRPILYILDHQDSVTISVFDNGNLIFGAYFRTNTEDDLTSVDEEEEGDWENKEAEEGISNIAELDTMDDDEMGGVDELADLNDVSDDQDSEEFEDSEEKSLEDMTGESGLELYGRDVLIYKYLTSALNEFYKNPLYHGNFIDTIVLNDGFEVSSELLDSMENDLMMDVEMNKIDINEVICDMTIKEVLR